MPEYRHRRTKAVRSVDADSDAHKLVLLDPQWEECPPAVTVDGDPAPIHEDRVKEASDDLPGLDADALRAVAEAEGIEVDKRLKDPDRIADVIRLARRTN